MHTASSSPMWRVTLVAQTVDKTVAAVGLEAEFPFRVFHRFAVFQLRQRIDVGESRDAGGVETATSFGGSATGSAAF